MAAAGKCRHRCWKKLMNRGNMAGIQTIRKAATRFVLAVAAKNLKDVAENKKCKNKRVRPF